MAKIKAEKAVAITMANMFEATYVIFLQADSLREYVLTQLNGYVTHDFGTQIIGTYLTKLLNGEHAVICDFPVPLANDMVEHADGSVSFDQHVHIEWSGGQVDDFTTTHVYTFEGNKIANERKPDGSAIRRQS